MKPLIRDIELPVKITPDVYEIDVPEGPRISYVQIKDARGRYVARVLCDDVEAAMGILQWEDAEQLVQMINRAA